MDDAARIPIDVGYETGAASEDASSLRTTVQDDGTVIIDILVQQPCEAEPTTDNDIVVCAARTADEEKAPAAPPASRNLSQKIVDVLSVRIGPVEIGPGGPDKGAGFTARVRF